MKVKATIKKAAALVLALLVTASFAACAENGKVDDPAAPAPSDPPEATAFEPTEPAEPSPWEREYLSREFDCLRVQKLEYGRDYTSLYDKFGKDAVLSEVLEDETGLAYIERDGVKYELGLDFLSKAMINNFEPCEGYETADEVYAGWWRLYIIRWNHLLPQIPLHSNDYYCVYNTQIGGVKENPVNPFRTQAEALLYWTSAKEDNSITIGNSSEISGMFRLAPLNYYADIELNRLLCGLELVSRTPDGGCVWNPTVVKDHTETVNEDGSRTFDIVIFDDLRFSDGSPVTAADYLVKPMVCMTKVLHSAMENEYFYDSPQSGDPLDPWPFIAPENSFRSYDGGSDEGRELKEARLISEYEFSVTVPAEYANDFYIQSRFCITPEPHEAWLGDAQLCDDGEGCYITKEFYKRSGGGETARYAEEKRLKRLLTSLNEEELKRFPWSGAYIISSAADGEYGLTLTLEKNPYFKGNYDGVVPSIERVIYGKVIDSLWVKDMEKGALDVVSGLTGSWEAEQVHKLTADSEGRFEKTYYSRAGYGMFSFRADLGPVQFASVRRAIAYCFDRVKYCGDFADEETAPVNAPYHEDMWMYKAAKEKGLRLDEYALDVEKAIEELEADGWIYDKNGEPYESGVRYKCIPLEYMDEKDLAYTVTIEEQGSEGEETSIEEYKVTVIGDRCYMPLALNYYTTFDFAVEDELFDMFVGEESGSFAKAGFKVSSFFGTFPRMIDELYQEPVYGSDEIVPKYNVFNFSAGFNSPRYDQSDMFEIDPERFGAKMGAYFRDYADIYWMKDE